MSAFLEILSSVKRRPIALGILANVLWPQRFRMVRRVLRMVNAKTECVFHIANVRVSPRRVVSAKKFTSPVVDVVVMLMVQAYVNLKLVLLILLMELGPIIQSNIVAIIVFLSVAVWIPVGYCIKRALQAVRVDAARIEISVERNRTARA
ncbi:hypothetical protein ANCDUO_27117, partial [Ancylostoma duodenale]